MAVRIQIRRDPSSLWTMHNPVLAEGEPGFETDTGRFKIGDGVTPWNDLPYASGTVTPAGPDGAIQFNDAGSLGGTAALIWDDEKIVIDQSITNPTGVFVSNQTGNVEFWAKALGTDTARKAGFYMALSSDIQAKIEFTNNTLSLNATTPDDSHEISIGNNAILINVDAIGINSSVLQFPVNIGGITGIINSDALVISHLVPSSITDYTNIDFALSPIDGRFYSAHPIFLARTMAPSSIPSTNVAIYHDSATDHVIAQYANGRRVLSSLGVDLHTFTVGAGDSFWVRIAEAAGSSRYSTIRFIIKVYDPISTEAGYLDFTFSRDYNVANVSCTIHHNIVSTTPLITAIRYVYSRVSDPAYIDVYFDNITTAALGVTVLCVDTTYFIDQDNDCLHPIPPNIDVSIPTGYSALTFDVADNTQLTSVNNNYEFILNKNRICIRKPGYAHCNLPGILNIQGDITQFFDSAADAHPNFYLYDVTEGKTVGAIGALGTDAYRIMSSEVVELYAGVTDFEADIPSTAKATLYATGRFEAKEFRPTSNYISVNGNAGYSGEITIIGNDSVYHHLTFENGILVNYRTS